MISARFTPFWCNMKDDLWKSGCCDLDSERKKVLASSNDSLACALIDLGAFWSVVAHIRSEKSILPYFSSLSMVAVSVPFPEARNRKGTESGLQQRPEKAETNQPKKVITLSPH